MRSRAAHPAVAADAWLLVAPISRLATGLAGDAAAHWKTPPAQGTMAHAQPADYTAHFVLKSFGKYGKVARLVRCSAARKFHYSEFRHQWTKPRGLVWLIPGSLGRRRPCINSTGEFDQHILAHCLDDATHMRSNCLIDRLAAVRLHCLKRAHLVSRHPAAAAGNIGKDGSQLSFRPTPRP
jgi:hypothetical protein